MLNRLYVDNYRALVNCELRLDARNLLMGRNGTGKTTFGDVVIAIQSLLLFGAKTELLFGPETLTRWQNSPRQRFEVDLGSPHGQYRYELTIEHRDAPAAEQTRTRIVDETLTIDGKPIFRFADGIVKLFRDDHTPGAEYPFDPVRSALGTIAPRPDYFKLVWFVRWMLGTTVVKPNPLQMTELVETDARMLQQNAQNFAAWYHAVSATDKRRDQLLHKALADVLPGFEALNFEFAGPGRWLLRADFNHGGRKLSLRFGELSEGQRQLILLYTILHFLLAQGHTVLLDEPDNYISLDEIQPWLLAATDMIDDGSGQLLIVSHHPEIFNQWAVSHGILTDRDGCGPVRIRKFAQSAGTGLTPAEEIARGWLPASGSGSAVGTGE
jgi:predicted ATPase